MSYDHELTDHEKRELLRIARATLREYMRTGRIPPGKPHRDCLVANAATFVTLHNGSELRGCIGTQEADKPLYKSVQEMAVAAASRDPRFPPVTDAEVEDIQIEVSVLGTRRPIHSPEEIAVGRDGIAITTKIARGLLLPQVARENGWDAITFLGQTCKKAGLAEDAWKKDDAAIETFTAQVFSDQTHPPQPMHFGAE